MSVTPCPAGRFLFPFPLVLVFLAWSGSHKLRQPSLSRQPEGYVEQEAGSSIFLRLLHEGPKPGKGGSCSPCRRAGELVRQDKTHQHLIANENK